MEKGAYPREEIWVQFPTCSFVFSNFICHLGLDRHTQKCRCSKSFHQTCWNYVLALTKVYLYLGGWCIPPKLQVLYAFGFADL